jgi:hypothetical protein
LQSRKIYGSTAGVNPRITKESITTVSISFSLSTTPVGKCGNCGEAATNEQFADREMRVQDSQKCSSNNLTLNKDELLGIMLE